MCRIFGLLVAVLLTGCNITKPAEEKFNDRKVYRDYVLCKCIIKAFDNDSVFLKDVSLTVYNEGAKYPLGNAFVGRKLDSLATIKVNSIKPSIIADYEGKKALFMECINYYNSRQLRDEIKVILKQASFQDKER